MRKLIKEILEKNGFKYEKRFNGFYWNNNGFIKEQNNICFHKKYNCFEIIFYLVPQLDHRFNENKTFYKMKTKSETKKYKESYRNYKDCVFFKMRDVEISYCSRDEQKSPLKLQPDSITFAGVRKLRELHKKYCPLISKGNWKHLSPIQLNNIIQEFDRFDNAILKALKERKIREKIKLLNTDFS